jgi:hypothetical protein
VTRDRSLLFAATIEEGPFRGLRDDDVIDCPLCNGSGVRDYWCSYRCAETGWEDNGPESCRYCGGCGEVLASREAARAVVFAAAPWEVAS